MHGIHIHILYPLYVYIDAKCWMRYISIYTKMREDGLRRRSVWWKHLQVFEMEKTVTFVYGHHHVFTPVYTTRMLESKSGGGWADGRWDRRAAAVGHGKEWNTDAYNIRNEKKIIARTRWEIINENEREKMHFLSPSYFSTSTTYENVNFPHFHKNLIYDDNSFSRILNGF